MSLEEFLAKNERAALALCQDDDGTMEFSLYTQHIDSQSMIRTCE